MAGKLPTQIRDLGGVRVPPFPPLSQALSFCPLGHKSTIAGLLRDAVWQTRFEKETQPAAGIAIGTRRLKEMNADEALKPRAAFAGRFPR
jgi:hypothetical protein